MESAKIAITAMFKSWPGKFSIVYFCIEHKFISASCANYIFVAIMSRITFYLKLLSPSLGTISLCAFDLCGISSFVEMLPLVEPFAQVRMYVKRSFVSYYHLTERDVGCFVQHISAKSTSVD